MHYKVDKRSIFEEKSIDMNKATISGDIIAYTSLSDTDKDKIENAFKDLIRDLENHFHVYSRIIKGDYLECYIPYRENALKVALAIKSYIKSIVLDKTVSVDRRRNAFKTHGIRLAIGIGELSRLDIEKGIIDGEAIYFSGRIISDTKATSNKERIVIKNTLFIKTTNEEIDRIVEPILGLLDVLLSKATEKQAAILYMKLLGKKEEEIANKLSLAQSTVNKHSTNIGWNAIEKIVELFEDIVITKL